MSDILSYVSSKGQAMTRGKVFSGKENFVYTIPVVLAVLVVFLTALIFWGAAAEERRSNARSR